MREFQKISKLLFDVPGILKFPHRNSNNCLFEIQIIVYLNIDEGISNVAKHERAGVCKIIAHRATVRPFETVARCAIILHTPVVMLQQPQKTII
jgi:hypothetical protein